METRLKLTEKGDLTEKRLLTEKRDLTENGGLTKKGNLNEKRNLTEKDDLTELGNLNEQRNMTEKDDFYNPVEGPKTPIDLAAISNGLLSNEFVSNETTSNELITRDPVPALLFPRRKIDATCAIVSTAADAVVAIANIPAIVHGIADLIKFLSDKRNCEVQTGSIAGTNVNFEYKTSGKNCDTTSQKKTIEAALHTCMETMREAHAEKMCCEFRHGGTWVGHVQVAANYKNPVPGVCENIAYKTC
ncbi:MAG: hypothetical protein Q9169_008147 [Polycauliona sp. 2 TL-2023]